MQSSFSLSGTSGLENAGEKCRFYSKMKTAKHSRRSFSRQKIFMKSRKPLFFNKKDVLKEGPDLFSKALSAFFWRMKTFRRKDLVDGSSGQMKSPGDDGLLYPGKKQRADFLVSLVFTLFCSLSPLFVRITSLGFGSKSKQRALLFRHTKNTDDIFIRKAVSLLCAAAGDSSHHARG